MIIKKEFAGDTSTNKPMPKLTNRNFGMGQTLLAIVKQQDKSNTLREKLAIKMI